MTFTTLCFIALATGMSSNQNDNRPNGFSMNNIDVEEDDIW